MPDGGAFHRAFHGPRPAAGNDIQRPQTKLVAAILGVFILGPGNGMATPANHQVRFDLGHQRPGIAHHLEYRVGDAVAVVQLVQWIPVDLAVEIHQVPDHRGQQ